MNFLTRWWKNQQDYLKLSLIKADVDRRIVYVDTGEDKYRYVPRNSYGSGDCQVFAATYVQDCWDAGFKQADKYVFKLKDGVGHVVCIVPTDTGATWVMDVRNKAVVKG